MMEFMVEVTVTVDDDEVDTPEKFKQKENEIRKVIDGIDPSIGVFTVENIQ